VREQAETLLAFDYGEKNIGVAVGQTLTGTANPLETIRVAGSSPDWNAISRMVKTWKPDALVVGLPLNMDDTEGPAAKQARADGAQLAARSGLEVHYQDERLTSDAADAQLAGSGRTRRQEKQIQDALAACLILEEYLRGTTAR